MDCLERVKEEEKDLQKKIDKLEAFINSKEYCKVDIAQQRLMIAQLRVMEAYNTILVSRIFTYDDKPGKW